MGIGQRLEQNGIDDTENGGVGADTQGERQDRDSGKSRTLAERAKGVAEVLEKGIKPGQPAEFPIDFLELCGATEANPRGADGLFMAHATAKIFFCEQIEMAFELAFEFLVHKARREPSANAGGESEDRVEHGGLSLLSNAKHPADDTGNALPIARLGRELLAAGLGDGIEAGLAIVFRNAPFRGDTALLEKANQRGVDGALIDLESV